jgi:hypothetical protein
VAYSGHTEFQTRHVYSVQQMAVMISPTMIFSSRSSAFKKLAANNPNYQVMAANGLEAGKGPAFAIDGNGPLASLRDPVKLPSQPSALFPSESTSLAVNRGIPTSLSSAPQARKTESSLRVPVWVLAICILLVVGILVIWRVRKSRSAAVNKAITRFQRPLESSVILSTGFAAPHENAIDLVEAWKDKLFQLETNRICGTISEEEYSAARRQLEEILKSDLAESQMLKQPG